MSALFNQTNIAPGSAFASGGGGNNFPLGITTPTISGLNTINGAAYPPPGYTPNPQFSTIELRSPTVGGGLIQFDLNPGVSATQMLPLYFTSGQGGYDLTLSIIDSTTNQYVPLGTNGVRLGTQQTQNVPYGYVEGTNDGVSISGRNINDSVTQVWYEAHSGANKVNCCSTITDAAKTGTLDFNAFLSTMASVYPDIVKPYA